MDMDHDSGRFIAALKSQKIELLKKIPKSDLHNHFVLGGSRSYLAERTGYQIEPFRGKLQSMQEMHDWNTANLGDKFSTKEMRKLLIEATFMQAKEDGVAILEIGEDVWGLGEYFSGDVEELIEAFHSANLSIAPNITLRMQIGLSRHCDVQYLLRCLEPFWGRKEFYSIDLYGDELCQPIENFLPIYQKAKEYGLKKKAHVGEWGAAEDIMKAIQVLQLDEVQHGIAAANSEAVMEFLVHNKIRLNITPSSNIILGRVSCMEEHPIGSFYRCGVDVTINSDDVLIFDSDVSKEYMRLYQAGVLTAEELDRIRINGLQSK